MELLPVAVSLMMVVLLFSVYRLSGGLFSLPFLVMVYIGLVYIGTLHFYWTKSHLTFLFMGGMGVMFLLGVLLADGLVTRKQSNIKFKKILHNPLSKRPLRIAIVTSFVIAFGISVYRLMVFGSPLLEGTIYAAGMEAVSGVSNKILYIFGPPSLLVLSVICYSVQKTEQGHFYIILTTLTFLSYLGFMVLRGGKSVAVMPFVLLFIIIYYSGNRIPKKLFISVFLLGGALAVIIGGVRIGAFSVPDIVSLYFERVTSIAALHLDYVLTEWKTFNSFQYGGTLILEVKRLIAQVTPIPKGPLYDQLISYMKRGFDPGYVSVLSPEVTFFGMSYVNFGIPGALIGTISLGFSVQWLHNNLINKQNINVFAFSMIVFFMFHMLSGIIRRGNLFITLQTYFLYIVPSILFIAVIYLSITLPFPNRSIWRQDKTR